MVAPLVAMAAIGAVTSLAQLYQAEKARGASEARLKQMQREFDALVPPNYDVSISDPPEYIQQAIPPAALSPKNLTPEQYQVMAKYKPEIAPLIQEQNPELVKQSGEAQEGRQAQLDALRQMRGIASSDYDPGLANKLSQASRQAQIDAQSRGASIQQGMDRRGTGNSGIAAMLKQQSGAEAMDREAMLGQNAAAEAYQNKLNAIRQSASMGGDINQQETSLAAKNAGIINDYNQRFTRANQDWQNQRTQSINAAQKFNLEKENDTQNQNVDLRNKYAMSNRDRQDQMARDSRANQVDERAYQNAIREKRANWQQGQKEYGNTLAGKSFDDRRQLVAGRNGLGSQEIAMNYQTAGDRNAVIQGLGNAGMGYYQNNAADSRAATAQEREQKRWEMEQAREDARWKMRRE